MTQRINWIDWSKSLCMFFVILGHTHLDDSGLMIKKIIYSFHMPLFFFISGILCKEHLSRKSIIRDVKYILVPYFFFGILSIYLPHPMSLTEVQVYLQNLICGYNSSIGAIWFLPAIFICKQLGTVIISIQKHIKWLYVLLVAFTFLPVLFLDNIDLPFFSSSALCGLPFFLIGYIFMKYYQSHYSQQISNRSIVLTIIFAISVLLSIFLAEKHKFVALAGHSYGNHVITYYINAFAGISSVISASLLLNRYKLLFVTVTSYGSISILWTHGICLSFFHYYLFKLLHIEISTYSIWLAILFSTLTYFCCYYITIFCDKHYPSLFGLKGYLTKDESLKITYDTD